MFFGEGGCGNIWRICRPDRFGCIMKGPIEQVSDEHDHITSWPISVVKHVIAVYNRPVRAVTFELQRQHCLEVFVVQVTWKRRQGE